MAAARRGHKQGVARAKIERKDKEAQLRIVRFEVEQSLIMRPCYITDDRF